MAAVFAGAMHRPVPTRQLPVVWSTNETCVSKLRNALHILSILFTNLLHGTNIILPLILLLSDSLPLRRRQPALPTMAMVPVRKSTATRRTERT